MKFNLSDKNSSKRYKKVLTNRINFVTKKFIDYVWNQLTITTPIRTGAARSNWNISINVPNVNFSINKTYIDNSNLIILDDIKLGDKVYVSNGAPYINKLNNGSSIQAPSLFVESAYFSGLARIKGWTKQSTEMVIK